MTAEGRPPRLPFAARRVVTGSRRLTDGQKHVWLELHALDRGDERGAWIGAVALSERVGRPVETVERMRKELQHLGLLRRVDVARGKWAYWYAWLPCECVPESPRPSVGEVRICVAALDQQLAGVGSRVTPLPKATGSPGDPPNRAKRPTLGSPVTPPLPQERAESRVTGDPTIGGSFAPLLHPKAGRSKDSNLEVGDVAPATVERQENGTTGDGDALARELCAKLDAKRRGTAA